MSVLLYGNECWTIFSEKLEATEMRSYRRIQRGKFRENRNKNDIYIRIRKTIEIFKAHFKKRGIGEFETHKTN